MNKFSFFSLAFSAMCLLTITSCSSVFSSTIKVDKSKYSNYAQNTEDNKRGNDAFLKKDYSTAFSYYQKSCDLNDGYACSNLGTMYWSGQGVTQDYSTAKKYFEKSCSIGNSAGCSNLSLFYERGILVPYDLDKAEDYAKLACDLDKKCCANLGIYRGNKGHLKEAKELLELSCTHGNAFGCERLAFSYLNGLGVPVNIETSKVYMNKACSLDEQYCAKTNTSSAPRVPTLTKTKETKVVEGRTSKKELLRNLGNPYSADTLTMIWKAPINSFEYYDINYVQKDGTSFIVCLGQQAKCKKEMVVNFMTPESPNGKNNIVQYVYFYD